MLKTEGIVLRVMPFKDHSQIVTLYTREHGRMDAIVHGSKSSKNAARHAQFQPFNVLEFIYYFKETRDLQRITESSYAAVFTSLHANPIKMLYGSLIIEVFGGMIREEHQPNAELYDFLKATLFRFESKYHYFYNYLVYFLVELLRFAGISPVLASASFIDNVYLNIDAGQVEIVSFEAPPEDRYFYQFANTMTFSGAEVIDVPQQVRKGLLYRIFNYVSYHLPGFNPPQSLVIFEEVFR